MRALIAAIAVLTALTLPASVPAQSDPPDSLYRAAPASQPAAANPTDGGRSTLLLALAALAVLGAGALTILAFRRPHTPAAVSVAEPEAPAVAATAPPAATSSSPAQPRASEDRTETGSGRFRRKDDSGEGRGRFRRKPQEPAVAEPAPEPAPPKHEPWRPRVVSDLPPLPAFGPGSEPPGE